MNQNRREFLRNLGLAAISITVVDIASAHEGNVVSMDASNLYIESEPGRLVSYEWAHHHHTLTIPLEAISNPPKEGVTLVTNRALFYSHKHDVVLTAENLMKVRDGQEVVVEDNNKDHFFRVRLA